MAYNDKQQKWLDSVSKHVDQADAQRVADNLFSGDHTLEGEPVELIERLVGLEYLERDGGVYRTRFPGAFGR